MDIGKPDHSNPFAMARMIQQFIEKYTREATVQHEDGSIETIRVMDFDEDNIVMISAEPVFLPADSLDGLEN
jgi:hypothetical protein